MKSNHWCWVLLAVGLVVGLWVGAGALERQAHAQGVPIGPPPTRFQISAWGFAAGQGVAIRAERGCYIVDTVTGELWHAAADGKPQKISEKLR